MTTKDNVIFFSISSVLIISVSVLLYISEYVGHDSDDKSLVEQVVHAVNNEAHKEKNLMISDVTTTIIAFGSLITILYGIPNYREKMRESRINKLKDRMMVLFSDDWNSQRVHDSKTLKKFFEALGPKFQKERYKKLHQTAFDELGREGRNPIWSAWELKRQMNREVMMQEMRHRMPGPGGIIHG